ncbi:unnamed protein product [Amoebophrya sp. A25]|nr:unnamed protein product [Amoebophrya sp. A25]|eukprot:GSA25T00020436001.1
MVVLNPRKFALLFTGGMTSIVASTVSLRGMAPLFSFVSAKERLPFAIAYAFAYFGTLYASLVMRSYFLTIVCIVAEVVSMLYLVLSYVPGGARFLNFVFATALSFCRVCLSRCMKMSSSGEEASSGSGGRGGILGL